MSIFYVRAYKPNFYKTYIRTQETVGDIFLEKYRNKSFFSEMFFFILNKYSVQDAFFLYNDQRVFISKLSPAFFDNILNWDQFGLNHIQLWFIKDSFLADRQFYYKTTTYQNEDILFVPTNWLTSEAVFTENSGQTKTVGDSSARLFSIGKTIISLINEAIEPDAYSAVVPIRNASGTFKVAANNQEFPGRQAEPLNSRLYYFWGGSVNFCDFPYFNQVIVKTTNNADCEPGMITAVQVSSQSQVYSLSSQSAITNAFAGSAAATNTWFRNKTKNTFIICNMRGLKTFKIAGLYLWHYGSNPVLDIVLLARRPIIGNTVGIMCPFKSFADLPTDGVTTDPGIPKQILTYYDLQQGSVDSVTGKIVSHLTARYTIIVINNGKTYGNNYFQYPKNFSEANDAGLKQAYLLSTLFNIHYQNYNARPDFISHYPLAGSQTELDKAKDLREDAFPDLRDQYAFESKQAFSTNIKMPIGAQNICYSCKVILEWTNPDTNQVFDVPFDTDTYLKINPFTVTGDPGSWREASPYGSTYNSMTNIISPKMYDQSKFNNPGQDVQRLCPYFMNELGIIQELPNAFARNSALPQRNSINRVDDDLLTTFNDAISDRQVTPAQFNTDYAEFLFGRQWDNFLKTRTFTGGLTLYGTTNVANYNETIVCANRPMQNGIRIFKNYFDKKLYYRFKYFPKFMIKIPYTLWTSITPICDFTSTFIPAGPITPNGSYANNVNIVVTLEEFAGLNIQNMTNPSAYPYIKKTNLLERTQFLPDRIRFVVGFYDSQINYTVTCTIAAFWQPNGTILVEIFPLDPHRWWYNFNFTADPTIATRNDFNNLTANFSLENSTTYVLPSSTAYYTGPGIIYWTLGKYTRVDNSVWQFKSNEFKINTQLNLERMQAGLLCLPQLNPPNGLNALVLGSDMFATSRGQLIPSFIENSNSRNIINFQRVTSFKSFSFYFNSLFGAQGRKTGILFDTATNYFPDIYIFFH